MLGRKTIACLFTALVFACALAPAQPAGGRYENAGQAAFEWVRRLVALGPRPPGSAAHQKQRILIEAELRGRKCEVVREDFRAQTPQGEVPMSNIIAKFPGKSGRIVVVSGHYDTYYRPGLRFVGANDGGSSTAFLLTLARLLDGQARRDDVWLVFFDGEESFREWKNNDHTYGSRHQVRKWSSDGTLKRIKALINVDMIGDADLQLAYEQYSTPWLRDLIWSIGKKLGYADVFSSKTPMYIEDDHVPFVNAGVSAVDLIDFEYGLFNCYWHTEHDDVNKLSARSFAVMLHVVSEAVNQMERSP